MPLLVLYGQQDAAFLPSMFQVQRWVPSSVKCMKVHSSLKLFWYKKIFTGLCVTSLQDYGRFCADVTTLMVEGCSHWMQQDRCHG